MSLRIGIEFGFDTNPFEILHANDGEPPLDEERKGTGTQRQGKGY